MLFHLDKMQLSRLAATTFSCCLLLISPPSQLLSPWTQVFPGGGPPSWGLHSCWNDNSYQQLLNNGGYRWTNSYETCFPHHTPAHSSCYFKISSKGFCMLSAEPETRIPFHWSLSNQGFCLQEWPDRCYTVLHKKCPDRSKMTSVSTWHSNITVVSLVSFPFPPQ